MVPITVKRTPPMTTVSPTAGRPAKSCSRTRAPRKTTRRRSSSSSELIQRPSEGTSLRISPYSRQTAHGGRANHAISRGDARTLYGFEAGMANVGGGLLDHLEIGLLEYNFLPGALSAGLFAGLLRPANDSAFAKGIESADQNFAKAATVSNQKSDGCNTPDNAEHGEGAACAVAPQGHPGFIEDLKEHASHPPRGARLRWDRWKLRGAPDRSRKGRRWFRERQKTRGPSAMWATEIGR